MSVRQYYISLHTCLVKQSLTRITLAYVFTPYTSKDGWTIGIKLKEPLKSENYQVYSAMMTFIRSSNDGTLLSFDVMPSGSHFDASKFKKVPIFLTFYNVDEEDQQLLIEATLYYFKKLSGDVSCNVDRFDCYPTELAMPESAYDRWINITSGISVI